MLSVADFLRVNSKASLKELLRALLSAEGKVVYVDIPADSKLWDLKSLRLIRRAGIETEKRIVVVSDSRVARIRAEQAGLTAVTEEQIFKGAAPSSKKTSSPKAKTKKQQRPSPATWISDSDSKADDDDDTIPVSRGRRRLLFAASSILALLVGFAASTFLLQKAVITVFARTETTRSSTDIFVDKNSINDSGKNIAAVPVAETFSYSQNFEVTSTANQGTPARGQIILHSTFSNTLTLRSDTTYLSSASGQRFRFTENVTGLRPNVPQTINVVAEGGGAGGNMAAGERLEVHNSAFGFRPQVLYAVVAPSGISGGSDELIKVVSEEDLTRARGQAREQAIKQAQEQVQNSLGELMVLIPELSKVEVVSEEFDAKAGDLKNRFHGSLQVAVSGLAFNKESVLAIAAEEGKRGLLSGQQFLEVKEGSLKYAVRSWDLDKGVAVLNVSFENLVTNKLHTEDLRVLLSGRSTTEIKDILLQKNEISGVRIDLSPFWLKSTPKSAARVKVVVELEK